MYRFFFIVSLLSILFTSSKSEIINVPADTSSIQGGIALANNGDTVLVHPGIYNENINFKGKSIVLASLFLNSSDTSYITSTIINGSQNGSVITFNSNEDSTTVLTGFTLTNGSKSGIFCENSNPIIKYNNVINNNTQEFGGGIYLSNSNATLSFLFIEKNQAGYDGGGIYIIESSPNINNSTISGNLAVSAGGGISIDGNSNPVLYGLLIEDNSSEINGGGIDCNFSSMSLKRVIITNNYSEIFGSGFSIQSGNSILINVKIINNNIHQLYPSREGGGISCEYSNIFILNSLIGGNFAEVQGGGIFCTGSSINLINSILYGNTINSDSLSSQVEFNAFDEANYISVQYSNIENSINGLITNNNGELVWQTGNISLNPIFQDSTNYYLAANSPCIDSGNPDSKYNDIEDPHNPGFALWPAYGTLRNDIGSYGGNFDSIIVKNTDINFINDSFTIKSIYLNQNYPNPFNPATMISYQLGANSFSPVHVELSIYNLLGQKVATLVDKKQAAGNYQEEWDASTFTSGVYIYKLKAGAFEQTRKMVLLR